MNKKLLAILIVGIVFVFASGCTKMEQEIPAKPAEIPIPVEESEVEEPSVETSDATEINSVVVEITSNGFSPKVMMVKAGQTVVFVNKDIVGHQPASGPHPIHTGYPGSAASKCGTAAQIETFDACAAVAPDSQYEFVFTRKGEWQFHDHLNPGMTGTLVVS